MPAPRRRITQDDVTELLSNLRASEQPPPEWYTANRLDGRSLRHCAGRLPQLARACSAVEPQQLPAQPPV